MLQQVSSFDLSEQEVLYALQIDTSLLNEPTNKIDADIVALFIDYIAEQKPNIRIGLEMGFRFPVSIMGIILNIYQNCHTLKDIFDKSPLYAPLVNTICQFSNYTDSQYFYHIMAVADNFEIKHSLAAKQIYESQYGIILQLIYSLTGKHIVPIKVCTPYKREENIDLLESLIKCNIEFEKPFMMVFDKSILRVPVTNANPEILGVAERLVSELVDKEQKYNIASITRKFILQSIPSINLNLKEVARKMNMSERTLQRKLLLENTSYQTILDNVRKELAYKYLFENIPFAEIAFLLGFESQSAFNKFFKKHFGMQPATFKRYK